MRHYLVSYDAATDTLMITQPWRPHSSVYLPTDELTIYRDAAGQVVGLHISKLDDFTDYVTLQVTGGKELLGLVEEVRRDPATWQTKAARHVKVAGENS